MQTAIATERVDSATRDSYPTLPRGGLKLLLALVSSERTDVEALKRKLRVADQEYESLLNELQHQYLVDVVSGLEGNRIHESLRLTEHGEAVLTRVMEITCELPE